MIAAVAAFGAIDRDGAPAIVAVIMAVTAAVGLYPFYQIFGLATCPVNSRQPRIPSPAAARIHGFVR